MLTTVITATAATTPPPRARTDTTSNICTTVKTVVMSEFKSIRKRTNCGVLAILAMVRATKPTDANRRDQTVGVCRCGGKSKTRSTTNLAERTKANPQRIAGTKASKPEVQITAASRG